MQSNQLTPNEAMILQQVYEDGEDDIRSLSYELGLPRQLTIAKVMQLEKRGLLNFRHSFDGLLLEVSARGKKIVHQLWPDAHVTFV